MPGHQIAAGLKAWWFGRRRTPSPADLWLSRTDQEEPQEVIAEYFRAVNAHDVEWMCATMSPERAHLYAAPGTVDRKRQSIALATLASVESTDDTVPLPTYAAKYRSMLVFKVSYSLQLAPERKDPSVREGLDWSYFVLVTQGRGRRWMIADWGR